MKRVYLVLMFVPLVFTSCGWILKDHSYDYLKEEQKKSIDTGDAPTRPIVDYYPIPKSQEDLDADSYIIPLPAQVFSSGSTNEIRMHKLGELRWLYVEALPSSVWPLMKDFMSSTDEGLAFDDPNKGILESKIINKGQYKTKLLMKIEHGIRQASSEIFLSHLALDEEGTWIKVSQEENIEDQVLRGALDFLSETPSTGGTSLVALNLNVGQKALLKQSEEGMNFIEMNLEFPRAWAAIDRALKEALITVKDLDRSKGVFFISFSKESEAGFMKRVFTRGNKISNYNFRINIERVEDNLCRVTVTSDSKENEILERDLLSEINQSLS